MTARRTYDDDALRSAVVHAHSWRGVLRTLGLRGTSAGALRSARRHADRLGLDYTHFTGQRRWTDAALKSAVAQSGTWAAVADSLGLSGGSSTALLKGHSLRLGLNVAHLVREQPSAASPSIAPDRANLRRAGSMLAAAWFELAGVAVSWPLEPSRYDLIAWLGNRPQRIQVKTTVSREGSAYVANISSTGRVRRVYDPDEIDQFMIVDGDLNRYLIPVDEVGGLTVLRLSAYEAFRLESL